MTNLRTAIRRAAAATTAVVVMITGDASALGFCGPREVILDALLRKFAETPVEMGLASNGSVIERLESYTGSWTLIMTTAQKWSCVVAAGEGWAEVAPKPGKGT